MAKTKGEKSDKLVTKKKENKKKANKKNVDPSTSSQAVKVPKKAASANGTTGNNSEENGIWRDARFQHLLADPRFRGVPKVQRKVKIDKRFQGMFTDDKFKVKYTVDKYGRPVNKSNAEDLRKFYELDENDSDEEKEKEEEQQNEDQEASNEQQERRAEELAIADLQENDALEANSDDSSDSELTQNLRERLTNPDVDYARGEGRLMTDSSSDEDSGDEENDEGPELQIDHVWGELDNDAESTEESTRRLAVCNMDWDRIRAEDLMVMLSSFLPPGGSILSVKIYPSEFGKARMAEEEVHGPKELVERRSEEHSYDDDADDDDDELVREQDSDAEEGDDYHMEKLRKYQLNRLRYYYAVVECDTVATADKVYQECDGIEYESSATRVDLRFIPDDTSFEEDTPTDECHELPDASSYKPRQFTTTALQQAKVDLTWDETALDRRELGDKLSSGQVDKLTDKELRQIVAYSSEEESESEEGEQEDQEKEKAQQAEKRAKPKKPSKQERIANYKNLLAEIVEKEKQEKEQKYEMEMSWNVTPDDTPEQEQQKKEQQQQQLPAQLTPIEKVLQKRSEKNKLRKEQRRQKQLEAKGGDGNDSDASLVPDGIDLNDAYFAEEFANGDYAPPKTKQQKKKTKSKGKAANGGEEDEAQQQQQERELELLLDDGDGRDEKQHFSLSKILKQEELEQSASGSKRKRRQQLKKSKGKAKQLESSEKPDDDFQVNVEDARFKAVYKSHEFNIDPTHSHYKATKGMQRIIGEKLKRRQEEQAVEGGDEEPAAAAAAPKRSKQQLEQNALVKSLKRKIQQQEQQRQRGQKL